MVAYSGVRNGVPWKLCTSLVHLITEINARWPNRDIKSDGSIGDAAHAKETNSDHNPRMMFGQSLVLAVDLDVDFDNDPASDNAPEVSQVLAAVLAHEATQYVIYDHLIWNRSRNFRPVPYTGPNPHTGHIHVSVSRTAAAVTSTEPWLHMTTIREVDDMPYTPEQLQQILLDAPIVNKWGQTHKLRDVLAAIDYNVVKLDTELDEQPSLTVSELLGHKVKAMDPKTGKDSDVTIEQTLTRASEATVVRQADNIKSATERGPITTLAKTVQDQTAQLETATGMLRALVAETQPDGTVKAREARPDEK